MQVSYTRASGLVRVDHRTSVDGFDDSLHMAHHVLSHFSRSKPGTTWGCDGVGYGIQKAAGHVLVNKSGVGPRKYEEGLALMRACSKCKEVHT